MQSKPRKLLERLIRVAARSLVFAGDAAASACAAAVGRRAPGKGIVLYYHSVPASKADRFRRQMTTLARHAEPVPADRDGPVPPGKRWAAVTFDDAYRTVLAVALPILKELRIPATVFACPGLLGTPWNDPSAESPEDQLTLTPEELAEAARSLKIGSHTVNHPRLTSLPPAVVAAELAGSRAQIERMTRRPVHLFCFPYGDFDARTTALCWAAGYRRAFTTVPVAAFTSASETVVGRVRVDPDDWAVEFRLKLAGAYRPLPIIRRAKQGVLRLAGALLPPQSAVRQDEAATAGTETGPAEPQPATASNTNGQPQAR